MVAIGLVVVRHLEHLGTLGTLLLIMQCNVKTTLLREEGGKQAAYIRHAHYIRERVRFQLTSWSYDLHLAIHLLPIYTPRHATANWLTKPTRPRRTSR